MAFKIFAGIIAVTLLVVYLAAPVIKLKDVALGVVVLIGIIMMLVDLWQSLQSEED
jgi:uncharacterized membrane protein YqjE